MSQNERNLAAVFLVFAAILVNQFSFLLAVVVSVVAICIHRGVQMSDLGVNVQNPNRAQHLVSVVYSWTESAVSAVARKCKRLAVSENRLPTQSFSSPRNSVIHEDYRSDSENVVYNRESIYQGSNLIQGRRINYKFQEQTNPYTANSPEWQRKSSSPSALNLNETHGSANRRVSEKDSFSHRGSPWGYSLSPQQRNIPADARPVQSVAGPLLASSKYNTNRDSALYVDVNSPGFGTRLLKYHSEAAIHQSQYARPGQLPLVHLNTSPLPSLSPRNSRKVRAPVRVRIATPSYDVSESRLFSRPENQQIQQHQSKSVVDVLKEISRKRIHTEDSGNEPKRHHRSDSSSSSSSSSSPALANGIISDQTSMGKRPREEDSPKLQKKAYKRTRNNEIYSSLSSSRNLCVGTKRKAADNWSRCSTPSPLGKHLKKSPHTISTLVTETEDLKSPEWQSQKQQESLPQVKQAYESNNKGAVYRNSLSPPPQEIATDEAQPSSSISEERHNEENSSNKNQLPKNHHGRLFVKAFSRGIANEHENVKDVRRNGGTKPWKTRSTVDVDTITGEDIVRQDFDLGSRRLNSMFSVLQSSVPTSMDSSKADVVDGHNPMLGSSKPSTSQSEIKVDTHTAKGEEKIVDATVNKQTDESLPPPATSISEVTSPKPVSTISEITASKPEQIMVSTASIPTSVSISTFGVVQSPSSKPSVLMSAKDKQTSGTSLEQPPITSVPSVNPNLALPVTSVAFSIPQATPVTVPVTSQTAPMTASAESVPLHSSGSLTTPSGTFGSVSTASFAAPQQAEKPPVTTTPSFSFGTSSIPNAASPLAPKSGFTMPTSGPANISAVSSASQPTMSSPFTILGSTPAATSSNNVVTTKSQAATSASGGFSFGATPAVTSSSASEFSILKTTSSVVPFGVSSPLMSTVALPPSSAAPLPSATTITSASSELASKPSFAFGTPATTSTPATTTTTSGGFNFQFGAGAQLTPIAAPKLQDGSGGFKFSFGTSKESTPLNQPSGPSLAKPPAFGEGFAFGATPGTNSQESKPMTFGTPTSLTPTLAASGPSGGGFNFSANGSAGANLQKPAFGFGTANPSAATNPPPLSGGFSFGAKPSEPAPAAAAAPNMATPFQFGSSAPAMPAANTLQPQQQSQAMGNPFSVSGTAEQKPSILGGGFSFGSAPSASMPTLQTNVAAFGQPSVPTFGAPNVNPLQSPPPPNPSLFQFGSGGGTMSQPGVSSGGFNFVGAPATGVPSAGFNFNPSGPSATTPFQFGATPLSAPAMFSIGSGSTAPRSRPRNRRQK